MLRECRFTAVLFLLLSTVAALAADTLTLRYDRPAEYFEEALVIGNGNLGAVIYGNPESEKISLNDITLWTGEPDSAVTTTDACRYIPEIRTAIDRGDFQKAHELNKKIQGHYSENYQPLGMLSIRYGNIDPASVTNYKRTLDLTDATASIDFTHKGLRRSIRAFASAPDSVIVIRIEGDLPVDAVISLSSLLPFDVEASDSTIVATGYAAYHSMPVYTGGNGERLHWYDPARGTRFCTILRASAADGTITGNNDGSLTLNGCRDVTLYVTNATSFNGFDRNPATQGKNCRTLAKARITKAEESGFAKLKERHIDDYSALFGRVALNLGITADSIASLPTDVQLLRYTDLEEYNPDLEELYFQYGRYLLISSSRTYAVPANLQGLWNESLLPPWSSNYTTNINVEENYWPAEVTALGELHAHALIPWIENLSKTGSATASNYYGVNRGWALGHNSDIWAMTNPVGLQSGNPKWASWNMGGAWLASHIWEHYLFSLDADFLSHYYPILRGAAEFCLDWLVERDGFLMTSPSTSPENEFIAPDGSHGTTLAGATADLAIIRQCLADACDATAALGVDEAFRQEVDSVLPRLLPYRVGHRGNLQEWVGDWDDVDPQHRHQSHLYGLYPGHHITPENTPGLAHAAARALEIKGENTTGWSTGWRINLYARLRDGEKAYRMFRRLLRYISPDGYAGDDKRSGGGTYPNLLDAHSPFQIDGNFGGAAGVAEMLIQSTPQSIILLPALPQRWLSGEVKGLRARGGFIVDIKWCDGKVTACTVLAPKGGQTTVEYNGTSRLLSLCPGQRALMSNGEWQTIN